MPLSRRVRGTGHMTMTAKFGPTVTVPLCQSPHRGILPTVTSWAAICQSVLFPWLPAPRLRLNPNALVLACVEILCRSLDEVSAEITQTPAATKLGGANIDAWSYEVIFFAGASATDLEILS